MLDTVDLNIPIMLETRVVIIFQDRRAISR